MVVAGCWHRAEVPMRAARGLLWVLLQGKLKRPPRKHQMLMLLITNKISVLAVNIQNALNVRYAPRKKGSRKGSSLQNSL